MLSTNNYANSPFVRFEKGVLLTLDVEAAQCAQVKKEMEGLAKQISELIKVSNSKGLTAKQATSLVSLIEQYISGLTLIRDQCTTTPQEKSFYDKLLETARKQKEIAIRKRDTEVARKKLEDLFAQSNRNQKEIARSA